MIFNWGKEKRGKNMNEIRIGEDCADRTIILNETYFGKTVLVDASKGPITVILPKRYGNIETILIKKIDSTDNPIIIVPDTEERIELESQGEFEIIWK